MTAVAMCAALASMVVWMYVKERGGSVLKWLAGFWLNAIVIQFALWFGESLAK
jgi:hypothetical protein